jgi:hypothetical protein
MLVNVVPPTNDFHALARYFVEGDTKPPHPDRVAWIMAHNLPTEDPEKAATLMAATAQLSKRCRKAAYHAMIAWGLDEKPTPEMMQTIALKTLELAGLAEHQALIMGHGDKPHRHLHMLINRVHPDTGRAWETKHDFALFDRIMKQLAEEHGFQFIPAHRYNPELTDDKPTKPNKRATWAGKRGAKTTRTQWSKKSSREFGEHISERLDRASSWEDLENAFAEQGLTLQVKGKGLVAGNATSYTKFSALRLSKTAMGFEQRFGTPYRPPARPTITRRPWFAVDGVDITKFLAGLGLADKNDVRVAIDHAKQSRDHTRAQAPLSVQMRRELQQLLRSTTLSPAAARPLPPGRATSRRSPSRVNTTRGRR